LLIAGSFTNLLWKETKFVGFGFLYEEQSNYFSVIYRPIPEKEGRCVENVWEPRDTAIFECFYELIDDN